MIPLSKSTASPVFRVSAEERAHAGQLEKMFAEHSEFVWRQLIRLGIAPADVEDALQEVFVVVYRRLGDYRERSAQRAWLYAICSRVSRKHRRNRHRRREAACDVLPELSVEPEQEQEMERRQALCLGRRLVEALPEKLRVVFVMYELDHTPMQQVASTLGCPLQTAYARLHRARERVRVRVAR